MFELIPILVGIIAILIIMPTFIKRMHAQNFLGKDMNKYGFPKVAELGGVVVFLAFAFAIFITTYISSFGIELSLLLGGFSTIAVIAFIGFIDDVIGWKKGIKQWQHALFPVVAALPLMAISAGQTTMTIPFFGVVELGILYSLIIIPIGITCAANAFNMLAGFNGLEAGQGIILTSTLTIIAFFSGQITAMILGLAMIGALIGFMKYNYFPAKIFGGDSLTLIIGANLAVMSIIGNMETYGVLLFALFYIEFLIKAKHKMKSECFGIPDKNGILKANPKGGSITQFILKLKPMKESQVTLTVLGAQLVVAIIVLAIFFLK